MAACFAVACKSAPAPRSPFIIPPHVLFDSIRTVVVTSATVVGDIRIADSTLSRLEILIEEKLREAGFLAVPAVEYASAWDLIAMEDGGFFDPYTGERNEEKYLAAVDRLQEELAERFDFDAMVYPEIWEVEAEYSFGTASWGGITEEVRGGLGYSGHALAATLFVAMQDTTGNELYVQEAGVQLLEYMLRGQLTALPPEQLFGDTTRISAAVSRIFDPLIAQRTPIPQ